MSQAEDDFFENEVRRIARARWPQAEHDGATMRLGRERDGIFETEEVIHYVEATTSGSRDKAKEDTKKLFSLICTQRKNESNTKGGMGWFITKNEPTAEQRDMVRNIGKGQVNAVSFAQFQSSIVNVLDYFSKRENHIFGSVKHPAEEDGVVSDGGGLLEDKRLKYIPLPLNAQSGDVLSIRDVMDGLYTGKTYVLSGDYGAGKSMTLREVYFKMKKTYQKGGIPSFPIYINLREHSGQDDPSELLERHARRIGFQNPPSLVAAWRAGFAVLLIDGFDEITTLGISKQHNKRLKETRRRSLEAVRKLLEQTPPSTGYVIAGRQNFFPTPEERMSVLGLRAGTTLINLGELTKEQVSEYVKTLVNKDATIPDWLPARPLLVAYLALRNMLQEVGMSTVKVDVVDGWNILLDKIFQRESGINTSLDGETLRAILERLATMARSTQNGLGPITPEQTRTAYIQICSSEPDEQDIQLVRRFPGLGIYSAENESLTFVDAELAEVCRAKDICRFIVNPYDSLQDEGLYSTMKQVNAFAGLSAIARVRRNLSRNVDADAVFQAIGNHQGLDSLRADIAVFCIESQSEPRRRIVIENAALDGYSFTQDENINLQPMTFRECIFGAIDVPSNQDVISRLPVFEQCLFSSVRGRLGKHDMPSEKFHDCDYEEFSESLETQVSILCTSISRGEKLVLTILRKLFVQSLGGRSESALHRGLDLNDRALVSDAILLLKRQELISLYECHDGNVWIPVRKVLNRVRRILASPTTCNDPLLIEAKNIG